MIHLILAVVLANPCMAPVHHKHHTVTPVQSCVVPAVPMCFRDVPDPEIAPAPGVYPYFITPPETDDEPAEGEGPYIEQPELLPVGGVVTVTHEPFTAIVGPPPRRISHAPEVSAVGTMPALTLLLGAIAVLRGRRA